MPRKKKTFQGFSAEDLECVRSIARLCVGEIDADELKDIRQELKLALYWNHFRIDRRRTPYAQAKFRRRILYWTLLNILRMREQPTRCFMPPSPVSLDEVISGSENDSPEDIVTWGDMITQDGLLSDGTEPPEIENLAMKIDMDSFLETLPPYLRETCEVLKTEDAKYAWEKLGICRKSLYNRICEIRERMCKAGLHSYLGPRHS